MTNGNGEPPSNPEQQEAQKEKIREYITLPFAVAEEIDDKTGQTVFKNLPEHITFTTILIDIEGERKKAGLIFKDEEKIALVSQVYYPLAIIPWMHERDLVMDPMGIWNHAFDYHRIVNVEIIMNELNGVQEIKDMKNALVRCVNATKEIAGVTKVEIKGMFYHEEFMKDLLQHMHLVQATGETKGFLRPKLDRDYLEMSVKAMHDLLEKNEEDIEKVSALSTFTHEKGTLWNETIDARIKTITDDYNQRIEILRPQVEEKVKDLERKKSAEDTVIHQKIEEREKELATVTTKVTGYEQNYQKFKGYKDKRIEAERERTKLNETVREQRTIKSRIRDLEKKHRETSEQYKTLIAREWDKINKLTKERDDQISALKFEKDQVNNALADLLSILNSLIEHKHKDIEELENQGVLTPTFSRGDYVYLPLYVGVLEAKDKRRILVSPPMVAKKGKGVIGGLRSAFGGLVLPLEPKTEQFEKTFKSGIEEALLKDGIFAEAITRASQEVNLLGRQDTYNIVCNGLETLLKEGWIKDKHYTQLKERFEMLLKR